MIIAHRGHSSKYPDNSKKGFIDAIKKGFNMIELDINICKTKEIVIYHDSIINGKCIQEYSLNELMQLNIITLDYYFNNINKNQIKTYIDVKGNDVVINYLIDFLNSNNNIDKSLIYIASFNINHLNIVKNSNLKCKLGFITCNKFTLNDDKLYLYDFYAFNWELYDNELYDFLKYKNKLVFLYTCHNIEEYKYIQYKYKYDGLISNIYIK
jgi:glycerophosphoryl diester phosphodiesterase